MGGSSGAFDSVVCTENSFSVLLHNEPSSWHSPINAIFNDTNSIVNEPCMAYFVAR